MLRIALCDDDVADAQAVAAIVRQYKNTHHDVAIRFEAFASGEELLEAVRVCEPFDLYLLDAIMPHMNGIELGIELRKRDRETLIAYMSVSPAFAVDSYKVHAFNYLIKPVTDAAMAALIDGALERSREKNTRAMLVKTKEGTRRVLLREIASAELQQRQIRYHLVDGTDITSITVRSSFANAIAPLLDDRRFVLSATSFAVNVACVTSMDNTVAVLFDGETVPVSRTHRRLAKQAWLDYWLDSPVDEEHASLHTQHSDN